MIESILFQIFKKISLFNKRGYEENKRARVFASIMCLFKCVTSNENKKNAHVFFSATIHPSTRVSIFYHESATETENWLNDPHTHTFRMLHSKPPTHQQFDTYNNDNNNNTTLT